MRATDDRARVSASLTSVGGALIIGAAAIATGVAAAQDDPGPILLLPTAACVALALTWLSITRFEIFLVATIVLRAALDVVKLSASGTSVVDPSSLLSLLFVGAASWWLLNEREEKGPARASPFMWPLIALSVAATLSVAFSTDPLKSGVELSRIATTILIVFVLNRFMTDGKRITLILGAVLISAIAPLAVATVQYLTGTGLNESGGFNRVTGTFLHPNPFAIYLTFVIITGVAIFRRIDVRLRSAVALLLVLSGIFLVLTYTRSGWIATTIAIALFGVLQRSLKMIALAVAVVVIVMATPAISERFADLAEPGPASGTSGNSLTWRFEYWEETLSLPRNPVLGAGLRTIEGSTAEQKLPHNDLVRIYVETGVLGLIAYLWFLLVLIRTSVQCVVRTRRGTSYRDMSVAFVAATVAFLILSMVSNIISQLVIFWYFLPLGMAAVAAARSTERTDEVP